MSKLKVAQAIGKAFTGKGSKRGRSSRATENTFRRIERDYATDETLPAGVTMDDVGAAPLRAGQRRVGRRKPTPLQKLQDEFNGLVPSRKRAERLKWQQGKETKFAAYFKFMEDMGDNPEAAVKALEARARGGLMKNKHTDYRKGGLFYKGK